MLEPSFALPHTLNSPQQVLVELDRFVLKKDHLLLAAEIEDLMASVQLNGFKGLVDLTLFAIAITVLC